MQEIIGQAKWTINNHSKGDAVYKTRVKENLPLWAPSREANSSLKQVLLPIKPTKNSNYEKAFIVKRKSKVFHQTKYVFEKTFTIWLGNYHSYAMFTRSSQYYLNKNGEGEVRSLALEGYWSNWRRSMRIELSSWLKIVEQNDK